MQVKDLQKLTDKQLAIAESKIKAFILDSDPTLTAEELDADIEEYLPRQYYKARASVKRLKILLNMAERNFTTLHIHTSPETQQWSDMEDDRFWTKDNDGYDSLLAQIFN